MRLPLLPVSSMNNSWDQFNWLMAPYLALSLGSLLKIGGGEERAWGRGYNILAILSGPFIKWTIQLHVPGCLVSRCSQVCSTWPHLSTQLPYLEINHWMFTHGHFSLKFSVSHNHHVCGPFFQGVKVGNPLFIVWHSLTSNMEVKECHVIKWKFMRSLLKNVQCLGVTLFIVLNRSVHTDLHAYCLTSSNKT